MQTRRAQLDHASADETARHTGREIQTTDGGWTTPTAAVPPSPGPETGRCPSKPRPRKSQLRRATERARRPSPLARSPGSPAVGGLLRLGPPAAQPEVRPQITNPAPTRATAPSPTTTGTAAHLSRPVGSDGPPRPPARAAVPRPPTTPQEIPLRRMSAQHLATADVRPQAVCPAGGRACAQGLRWPLTEAEAAKSWARAEGPFRRTPSLRRRRPEETANAGRRPHMMSAPSAPRRPLRGD
jgi:hypothetical protein